MEEFVKFAISKGIRKYGFSSHAPLPFHTSWNMVADEFEDYEKEFYRLKDKFSTDIELFIGLEVDFVYGCTNIADTFYKNKKLDYAIGSVHYLDRLSGNNYMSIDGPFAEFDQGLKLLYDGDIKKATLRFFEISELMIQLGGFDIVGHVDKIILHAIRYKEFDINASWYVETFSALLRLIKSKGLLLEINTKSLFEHGITYPIQSFYQLIKDLEIPIMINSDCHYPDKIIAGFAETYRLLYELGFSSLQQLTNNGWKPFLISESGLLDSQ
jgi:histidinol-phosphatase (PHP family)